MERTAFEATPRVSLKDERTKEAGASVASRPQAEPGDERPIVSRLAPAAQFEKTGLELEFQDQLLELSGHSGDFDRRLLRIVRPLGRALCSGCYSSDVF